MVIKSNDDKIDQLVSRKKIKKLTEIESIITEMNKGVFQNAASLKARLVKNMKTKVKVLVNMKIWYPDTFFDLILTQFSGLIHTLKAKHDDNRRSIVIE